MSSALGQCHVVSGGLAVPWERHWLPLSDCAVARAKTQMLTGDGTVILSNYADDASVDGNSNIEKENSSALGALFCRLCSMGGYGRWWCEGS